MVLFDSLNYMMKILAPKRQDQLEKYMKRHELIFSSQARDDIFSESSSKIIEVQDLFGI